MAINFRELFALRAKRWMVPAATIAALVAAGAPPAWAADYFVTNTTDSGAGSLRQAILDLNTAGAGTHSIAFSSSLGTISIANDLPPILGTGQNITITGNGNTVDGGTQHALLFIGGGVVEVSDLNLSNGHAQGGKGGGSQFGGTGGGGLGAGGALFVNDGATVTISGVAFTGNQATGGSGGDPASSAVGGGGGGFRGNGGDSAPFTSGGGGGGGFGAPGGTGDLFGDAGGGGGGVSAPGGNASGSSAGSGGGGEGGSGSSSSIPGTNGQTYGGGGGGAAVNFSSGSAGGDFGGGGGGAGLSDGGNGGFGAGGGGGGGDGAGAGDGGSGGFGGGRGGRAGDGGNGGNGMGGAIFVRQGGSLTIVDSGVSGSQVTAGQGGFNMSPGSNGTTAGAGLYLHTGTTANVEVTNGQTSTWADDIAGNGGLTKTGAGTLVLGGANTYGGATQVNAGTLVVNGAHSSEVTVNGLGALGGTGTLNSFVSNGTVRPGNSIGTLAVNNDAEFNPGSTLQIEINDGGTTAGVNNDLITAIDFNINGGTVVVISSGTAYTAGSTYTFLQAGHNVNGTFDSISDDLAFFDAVLGYTSDTAFFTLVASQADFHTLGHTVNQRSLGSFLDHLHHPPHDLQGLIDQMSPMATSQVLMSLDQLTGSIYGSSLTASQQHATFYLSQLAQRLRGRMTPGDALSSSGYADASDQQGADFMLVSYVPGGASAASSYPTNVTNHRAWVTGYGMGGSADGDGNADGFSYGLGGTQFAIEKAIAENWAAGFWGNTAWGQLSGDTLAQSTELESYHFGGYLVGFDGCDYWIALGGGGYNHTASSRNIGVGAVGGVAQANVDGGQATAYLERGRSFCHAGWTTQPYAALQYVYIGQEGFTENGAGPANLTVDAMDSHSMRSIVGGRISTDIARTCCRTLTPELRAAWVHEFLDTNQAFTASLPGVGGGFAVQGVDLGRDWALLGTGLNLQMGASTRLFGGYDLQVNDYQAMHIGSGGVEYVW